MCHNDYLNCVYNLFGGVDVKMKRKGETALIEKIFFVLLVCSFRRKFSESDLAALNLTRKSSSDSGGWEFFDFFPPSRRLKYFNLDIAQS